MKIGQLEIQDHRMCKYIGKYKTTAPSYYRIIFRGKHLIDIPAPRYDIDKKPRNLKEGKTND